MTSAAPTSLGEAEMSRLFTAFRTTTLLCLVLGGIMFPSGLLGLGEGSSLDAVIRSAPLPSAMRPLIQALIHFSRMSGPIVLVWSGLVLVAGVVALRRYVQGQRLLLLAAWTTIVAMVMLALCWSAACAAAGLGRGAHALGWAIHLLQALIVVPALLRLRDPRLTETLREAERRTGRRGPRPMNDLRPRT